MNETIPHLVWRELLVLKDGHDNDPRRAILDTYFAPFAMPTIAEGPDGTKTLNTCCLNCGGTGFEWGIQHGEGHCRRCGWPARAYHPLKDEKGEEFATLTLVLQYHPNSVTEQTA